MFEKAPEGKAALYFLGQAGYYAESCGISVLIDPYLSDSVWRSNPLFTRLYPPPVKAEEIRADVFIVTHDHLDHLDPETIAAYAYKDSTEFVAPRHGAKKLELLGVPKAKITVVDHGDKAVVCGLEITGIFALGTSSDVVDTTGYYLVFPNGKSLYHSSDTGFCRLLLESCPRAELLLVCINGKYGNLGIQEAVELTKAVRPRLVVPNHYDVMALNSENPESFLYACGENGIGDSCRILKPMEPLVF